MSDIEERLMQATITLISESSLSGAEVSRAVGNGRNDFLRRKLIGDRALLIRDLDKICDFLNVSASDLLSLALVCEPHPSLFDESEERKAYVFEHLRVSAHYLNTKVKEYLEENPDATSADVQRYRSRVRTELKYPGFFEDCERKVSFADISAKHGMSRENAWRLWRQQTAHNTHTREEDERTATT